MKIKHKFTHVNGDFDTDTGAIICVQRTKYAEVVLCFKANMNIPFAEIKLFDTDLYKDAEATMEDAYKLGREIAHRWNSNINTAELNLMRVDISVRLLNILKHGLGIENLAQCAQYSRKYISNFRNIGTKTMAELDEILKEHNIKYKQ